ncbi:sulfite exporter TauE/SafE family protein [Aquirufa lenticrescens]
MHTWYYTFLIGLAGSWHCFAMCGPIVAQINARGKSPARMLLYPLGRIFIYGALGYFVAGIGSIWLFPNLWSYYYVLAGVFILLIISQNIGEGPLAFLHQSIGKKLQKIGAKMGPSGYFVLGMANGLLPCGLVVAGLSVALIQPKPIYGAFSMVILGIATLPALQLYIWGSSKLKKQPIFQYLGWFVAGILLFRGAWGIGMAYSDYLAHSSLSPIICHPFSI